MYKDSEKIKAQQYNTYSDIKGVTTSNNIHSKK